MGGLRSAWCSSVLVGQTISQCVFVLRDKPSQEKVLVLDQERRGSDQYGGMVLISFLARFRNNYYFMRRDESSIAATPSVFPSARRNASDLMSALY